MAKEQISAFFIDKCIFKFLDKLFVARQDSVDVSKKKDVVVALLYRGKIYIELIKRLRISVTLS